jgi:hypothetical protein
MSRAEKLICWLATGNFVICAAIGLTLGDAQGGRIVDGRYFLNNHGRYHEVSRTLFIFDRVVTWSAIPGLCLAAYVARRARRRDPAAWKDRDGR